MSALRDALRDLSEDVFFDLLESEDAYLVVLDVPGITADSLEVSVENRRLTVDAHREKDLPGSFATSRIGRCSSTSIFRSRGRAGARRTSPSNRASSR